MEILGRLKPYWAWIASAALVAGALAVVQSTGPDDGGVETRTGQFVDAALADDQKLDTGTLKIPGFDVTFGVTAPIDPADLRDFPGRSDPTSGSYLGLRISSESSDDAYDDVAVRSTEAGRDTSDGYDTTIAVYADGRRYAVPNKTGDGYLAVAGRPRDVVVAMTVDGVRQTVRPSTGTRDTGKAGGLYVRTTAVDRRRACGSPELTAGFRPRDFGSPEYPPCAVVAHGRTAYVRGLGWAAPGRLWQYVYLTVNRRLDVERVVAGRPTQAYRSQFRDNDLAVSIDGRPSTGSPRANAGVDYGYDDDALAVAQVAQDAPPSTVRIDAGYHRLLNITDDVDNSAPTAPDVTVTWTEKLS